MTSDRRIRAVYMQQFEQDGWLKLAVRHEGLDIAVVRTADELAKVIADAEILIANNRVYDETMGPMIIERGKKLRWIQFSTAGIERGIRFGMPRGIPVCNIPGIKGATVAEHAMLLLLASFRRWREIEAARGRKEWIRERMHETIRTLEGATLVICGYGAIGQEVARKAKAFDMRVIAVSRAAKPGPTVDEVIPRGRLHDALARADAVVLCLPVEPNTVGFIGEAQFACMKPDAFLINVGRGELVDEAALIRALGDGRVGGAAIDVTAVEPLPADSPLWRMDNVLLSPHVSGTGKDGSECFDAIFRENLAHFRAGAPLLHVVDWAKGGAAAVV
ncbi:MAG: D-2-hydroxyacid dehydrogenase [Xanthobacteraceae bacterium]